MKGRLSLLALTAVSLLATSPRAADNEKAECATAAETAEKLREEKRFQPAREALRRCSRESCPKIVRHDCLRSLASLEESQPTVVFRAQDHDGADIVDVQVLVDGVSLAQRLDGRAWPLDPGTHQLALDASASGFLVAKQTLVVAEGEKNRVVAVRLERPAPAASSSPASPAPVTVPPPAREERSGSALPWMAGGVGVAGLATFGVVELLAHARYSELRDGCGVSGTCASDDVSALRTRYVISGVALAIGTVGIVTSAFLFALSPRTAVGAAAGGDGARATLRVRF